MVELRKRNGKTRMVTIRLDHDLHNALDAMAEHLGVDRTTLVRAILRHGARDAGLVEKLREERTAMSAADLFG